MNAIPLWTIAAILVGAVAAAPHGAQGQNASPQPPASQQPGGASGGVPTGNVPTTPGVAPSTSHTGKAGSAVGQSPEQGPASGTGLPRPGTPRGNPPGTERSGAGEGRGG